MYIHTNKRVCASEYWYTVFILYYIILYYIILYYIILCYIIYIYHKSVRVFVNGMHNMFSIYIHTHMEVRMHRQMHRCTALWIDFWISPRTDNSSALPALLMPFSLSFSAFTIFHNLSLVFHLFFTIFHNLFFFLCGKKLASSLSEVSGAPPHCGDWRLDSLSQSVTVCRCFTR